MKSEYENNLDEIVSQRYRAKLMNDTQWHEVFTCLAKSAMRFQIAWINTPDFPVDTLHSISLSIVDKHGLCDPGIGGPCYYKEINYVRIPKSLRLPKAMRGEVYGYQEKEQNVESLLKELRSLGQLPFTVTSEYLEIKNYA